MEALIFVGLQGAGKSTFYRDRFAATHARINLDELKTRRRERARLAECIGARRPFVVDNTNPTRAERAAYLRPALAAGYRAVGIYFRSRVAECWPRVQGRPGAERVPLRGLLGTAGRLERPSLDEGFAELRYVRIVEGGGFEVSGWRDEDR